MTSSLFLYLISGFGLTVTFLLFANCLHNLFEYAPMKSSVLTGLFLGLCCFAFNAYYFSYQGAPVFDLRFAVLILTAICFERRVFIAFSPLYLLSVLFSPFSIWFALAAVVVSFVILMIKNGHKAASLLFIPILFPLVFSEIFVMRYMNDYSAKVLLTLGVGVGFFITVFCLAVMALVDKNVFGAVFGRVYLQILLAKNDAMYPFRINRAGTEVILSKRCADYFEFLEERLPYSEFETIFLKSTDSKLSVLNKRVEEGLFVTLNTRKDLYIRYACFRRLFGGYKGFFHDITSSTPRRQMLYQAVERDYTTGLPTFSVLKESVLSLAKKSTGNMLFASIELRLETFRKSVYDIEFEYGCYRYLADLLKTNFPDAGLYSVKSGEFVLAVPSLERSDNINDMILKLKNLLYNNHNIGERNVIFSPNIGVFRIESVRINGFNQVNEALKRLFFCKSQAALPINKGYYFFRKEDYDEYLEKQFRERDLDEIFKAKKIHLVYQPIIDVLLAKPILYEVLVRVDHEKYRDTVRFVEDCIEYGLDVELDNMVIGELLRLLKDGMQPESLSINLLGNTPISKELAVISNMLNKSGKTLFLEFTEYIKTDLETLRTRISEAKQIGAKIIIDDFGTQYSNYELLSLLSFDVVKIPIEFINGVAGSKKKQYFVRTVVDYAKEFGVLCVAEGMENKEDLAKLKELSVRYFQGFLFDRPLANLPADANLYRINLPPFQK